MQWSDEDNCFLVGFPDFPGQQWRKHGNTYESAVTSGIEALESLVMAYESNGEPLPEPSKVCTVAQLIKNFKEEKWLMLILNLRLCLMGVRLEELSQLM